MKFINIKVKEKKNLLTELEELNRLQESNLFNDFTTQEEINIISEQINIVQSKINIIEKEIEDFCKVSNIDKELIL